MGGVAYECPECGAELGADAQQCPGCGLDFVVPSEAESDGPPPPMRHGASRGGLSIGALGPLGVVFLALAVLAATGSVLLMHWDVWVNGASVESIGDRQRLLLYLAVLTVVVCAIMVVLDLLRRRK